MCDLSCFLSNIVGLNEQRWKKKNLFIISGVFSTGAMGAIAPVILRKRLIAPEILHLPRMYLQCTQILKAIDFITESFRLWYFFFQNFSGRKFLLHFAPMYIINFASKNLCLLWDSQIHPIVLNQKVVTSKHHSAFF